MTREHQVEVQLKSVVDELVDHTQGAVPRAQLAALVDDLYDLLAATATISTFLPVLVARQAMAQIAAGLPEAQEQLKHRPEVLIVCRENAGRSQAAAALFRHYAAGLLFVESAGLAPGDRVLPTVVEALAAHGVHLTDEAKALTPEMMERASHVIVIGDHDLDGIRWDVPALDGLPPEQVWAVLGDIDRRVRDLLAEWLPDLDLGEPVMRDVADLV